MRTVHSTQNNKLVCMNTDAARKMKNDTVSAHCDIYSSIPALKPDEDLAFGRLASFLPECDVILHNNPLIANDLYEHEA